MTKKVFIIFTVLLFVDIFRYRDIIESLGVNVANLQCITFALPWDPIRSFNNETLPTCPPSQVQTARTWVDYTKQVTADRDISLRVQARLAWEEGNLGSAERHLEQYIKTHSEEQIWALVLGNIYLLDNNVDRALLVWKSNKLVLPSFRIGHALLSRGEYKRALDAFDAAIVANPQQAVQAGAYSAKAGITYYNLRDPYTAMNILEKAIENDPLYDKSYAELARIQRLENQLTNALHIAELGIQRNGKTYSLLVARGEVLVAIRKSDEAISVLEEATRLSSQESEAWFWLGWAFRDKKLYEQAEQNFVRAIQQKKDNVSYYYFELGQLYEFWNRRDKAIQVYTIALSIDPSARFIEERLKLLTNK